MKTQKLNAFQEINSKILNLLDQVKNKKFEKGWFPVKTSMFAINPLSKTSYKGVNLFMLAFFTLFLDYTHNRWVTFNQCKQAGGQILKGAKGAKILFYKIKIINKLTDNKIEYKEYKNLSKEIQKNYRTIPIIQHHIVFNIENTTGLSDDVYRNNETRKIFNEKEIDEKNIQIQEAENIINSWKEHIIERTSNSAYYNHATDKVMIPLREQFKNNFEYYRTIFHELGHFTGHPSRLNRKLFKKYGDLDYAKEELTAELTAAYLMSACNIDFPLTKSAKYIDGWIDVLNRDEKTFFQAANQAEKAVEMILQKANVNLNSVAA